MTEDSPSPSESTPAASRRERRAQTEHGVQLNAIPFLIVTAWWSF
ncbi:hypothetical protein [Nesterenkonia pannonica]|nr:hypothetical protein [Nesterenkonia pannonica]